MSRPSLLVAGLSLLVACAPQQPPAVLLQGSRSEISALAGEWTGSYSSVDSRRDGSILFSIRAGADTAHGDVMMISERTGQRLIAEDAGTRAHLSHAPSAEYLRITFVHVLDGVVEGALEPYVAPDCHCVVTTVFRGTVRDREIAGEYVSRGDAGLRQVGTWQVRRSR
jgi:hypothetical protein